VRLNKFRGLQWSLVFDMPEGIAQIFDNLVGCSKEELVSNSELNRGDLLKTIK
jgi:hypothetical protein